jgi:hypothetical protein
MRDKRRAILEEMYDDVEDIDFAIKEKIDQTISKLAKLELSEEELVNIILSPNYDLCIGFNREAAKSLAKDIVRVQAIKRGEL